MNISALGGKKILVKKINRRSSSPIGASLSLTPVCGQNGFWNFPQSLAHALCTHHTHRNRDNGWVK